MVRVAVQNNEVSLLRGRDRIEGGAGGSDKFPSECRVAPTAWHSSWFRAADGARAGTAMQR